MDQGEPTCRPDCLSSKECDGGKGAEVGKGGRGHVGLGGGWWEKGHHSHNRL